jgi:hypothetical protein
MPKTKTINLTITLEWEDADIECGINAGYMVTDVIDTDTKKILDFSHEFYTELTEKLS